MKHGKLKRMEEDLKSCPTVMLRVPISGSAASGSNGSNSKKDHKMPRRIIATVNSARSTSGSKSVLRNSETDSISRYSVFSSRSQRRSGAAVSDGASTVRSKMSIRRGGNCCGYHVPGHVVLGVVIFSALTLWHHTNYFTPNSYLSPYITAMRDVTAETAQALYPPFENQNQAILQAMDMKSASDNSNYAEPQGMKVPHPNAAEMREFIRRAQSSTQRDMIRMEILGESTGSDLKGVSRKQLKKQDKRSLQDDTKDEEESNARDDESSSKKRNRKKQTDEDAEDDEKGQSSSEGKKKASSRKQESREDEEEDNTATGSPPRKNLRQGRSAKSAADDKDDEEAPAVKKTKKETEEEPTSSTSAAAAAEEKVKEPPKREEPEETPEVSPKTKPIKKEEESTEDELIPAHKVSDDPCMTMVTTIDPVKGIIQKKIPLVSCQK